MSSIALPVVNLKSTRELGDKPLADVATQELNRLLSQQLQGFGPTLGLCEGTKLKVILQITTED